MIKHADSHLDHGLTETQVAYLLARFAARDAFFIETLELPEDLGTVPCGLHGPCMGDLPIVEAAVTHEVRGARTWTSRLVDLPARPTRLVTVIAGPHDGHSCVLYTAFGGPQALQEPGDLEIQVAAASAAYDAASRAWADGGKPEFGELYEATGRALAKLDEGIGKQLAAESFWLEHALAR